MLSKDLLNKLNFVSTMVLSYNKLVLPRDWWYTSVKRDDGYINVVDMVVANRVEISNFLTEHHIKQTYDSKRHTFTYTPL